MPFIHKITQQTNFSVHTIKILTIGGKYLWEEDTNLDVDTDILNINDIYRKGQVTMLDKKLKLCEVDTDKTNVADFYKWSEITSNDDETFCWRTYTFLMGAKGESWLNIPKSERLGNVEIGKLISTIIARK